MKKNSWHFKLHKFMGTQTYREMARYGKAVSLCEYFWKTAFTAAIACVICFASWIALINPLLTLLALLTGFGLDFVEVDTGMIFLFIILPFTLVTGCIAAYHDDIRVFPKWLPVYKWIDFSGLKAKLSRQHSTTKEPSLILQYIKAKKEKFCPMLKLDD